MITIVIDSVTILSSSRIAESRLPSCVPGVLARSFRPLGSLPGHFPASTPGPPPQGAIQAISQQCPLCPLEGTRNFLWVPGGSVEPALQPLSRGTPARCGLEGASQPQCRGPGVSGIPLNPLIHLLFLTYIVPAGSRATPNMHKIQSLILGTRRAQPQVSYPMQTTYSAAGQPAPQTWPPDVLCSAFVLSERLSAGSLFYNWQISRKIQISVSACKTGRRTATPSHSNTCSAPAQLPLWAGPMLQLATLSTRPYHPAPEPPRCPSPRWRLRHIWPCRPRLQESLD